MKKTAMVEFYQDDKHEENPVQQFNDWYEDTWTERPEGCFKVVQVVVRPETRTNNEGLLVVFEFEEPQRSPIQNDSTADWWYGKRTKKQLNEKNI